MTRTNIELDDDLVAIVMARYRLETKRAAVDLALRHLVGAPMSTDEILAMAGIGFDLTNEELEVLSSVDDVA